MAAAWTNEEIELVAERAYQLHLQGKNEDALTIFEGLLTIDPRNVYCLQAVAALNLSSGSVEKAVEYASRALAFSPKLVEALACRCEANVTLRRLTPAQQDLESLRQLRAGAHVARLAMRLASASKSSTNLLPDATMPQLDR
jgi:predicted Zn-dependent protease